MFETYGVLQVVILSSMFGIALIVFIKSMVGCLQSYFRLKRRGICERRRQEYRNYIVRNYPDLVDHPVFEWCKD